MAGAIGTDGAVPARRLRPASDAARADRESGCDGIQRRHRGCPADDWTVARMRIVAPSWVRGLREQEPAASLRADELRGMTLVYSDPARKDFFAFTRARAAPREGARPSSVTQG